ncbi:LacI family DNA-binding transcriptional regulator [Sphingobacterium sp. BN32]|uniref:LacI family DNA-binding transcriptional regulator n=1 Tax=Sphingobacterium sp. BN32 TaxID=3058432 RepID=UPI00265D3F54|nr:LacI family DNA-binding transcriptional regulator [Sphingobacterium sp. BN32]WKK56887.1 LacI family DNA-binding transcriptional regulator [Sphingobacterium sp. BN32]
MKATELSGVKEIARRANVSIATVDRVLHNRVGVALKTKEKIESIIKDMDYKPNILAKRLASKRVHRFAVLMPRECVETDYWRAPLLGIQSALNELGDFGVELTYFLFDRQDAEDFKEMSESVLENAIDAVIVAPIFPSEAERFVKRCEEKRIKYLFINNDLPSSQPLSFIGPDQWQTGRLAANLCQYIIRKEDRILVLNIQREFSNIDHTINRLAGFESFFAEREAGWNILKLDLNAENYDMFKVYFSQYLQQNELDVIFVTNAWVYWVARYFEEHSISNIILMGYDYTSKNIDYVERGGIDFLICQKPLELGYKALATLFEHFISKRPISRIQYMPIDIVTKENSSLYKH